MFFVVGIVTAIIHAGAMCLLVAAVFAGRPTVPPRWPPPVDDEEPLVRGAPSDTRFQS
jgi:hypothetical protein